MMKNNQKKRKSKIVITTISLLLVGIVLYMLADRYLIDHVEISNAFTENANISEGDNKSYDTDNVDTSIVKNDTAEAATVEASQPEADGSENSDMDASVTAEDESLSIIDDWNYIMEGLSIKITQESKGSGSDTITYYVADVEFDDLDRLNAAFAYNQFGTNIIQNTSKIAENNEALLAINGDYYGFREDGIVIRNGEIFRDEPTRIGLAIYEDGTMASYDETSTSAAQLIEEGVIQTLSFGPVLVDDGIAVTDFGRTVIDTNIGNHAIENANPRTGIGMISANHFVFIVVDGRSKGYSRGMTLEELAQTFADLGCSEAYNLDGGGSSTMYFMGRVVNNPLGKNKERGVSDILYIN